MQKPRKEVLTVLTLLMLAMASFGQAVNVLEDGREGSSRTADTAPGWYQAPTVPGEEPAEDDLPTWANSIREMPDPPSYEDVLRRTGYVECPETGPPATSEPDDVVPPAEEPPGEPDPTVLPPWDDIPMDVPTEDDVGGPATEGPALLWRLKVLARLEGLQDFSRSDEALPSDMDGGGCYDGWERRYGLDPCDREDDLQDTDGDGWTNFREMLEGTSPIEANTDGDIYRLDSTDPHPLEADARGQTAPGGIGSSEGWGQGLGQGNDQGETNPGGIPDSDAGPSLPEREVEEADIVNLKGETLYILNAYKGLVIVDVSEPDKPWVLGTVPVLGEPVDMYVVGSTAYMIVSCNFGYWYSYMSYQAGGGQGEAQGQGSEWSDNPEDYMYQIGTRLVVADVSDPVEPTVKLILPIEGFVTESRKVGDVIYYVSTCHSWYNRYTRTNMNDCTYVVSLNIAELDDACVMDQRAFEGNAYQIHASSEHLYVAQWKRDVDDRNGWTDITMVDISDPRGSIHITDRFSVAGRVWDKYQMDEHDDTFRVVSHKFWPLESWLWTFDIADPEDVMPLGELLIDDVGDLMATRFAGDRAYTIHLPRRAIDPLDVIDLSDPTDPVLCDVFEMPGWVTHMEVRGYKILAIGVDDSEGERNVAVSLFDVSDPWNAVMEDRVRIGGSFATSEAVSEPKALTVLDDQGVALVPYTSTRRDAATRLYITTYGVQVVSFDLEAGDLEVRGSFEQMDNVLRTRSLGDRALSTSREYLVVADLSDLDAPRVTATLVLCSMVVDYHADEDRFFEVVMSELSGTLSLHVYPRGTSDLMAPLWSACLGTKVVRWFWDEDRFHVVDRCYLTSGKWTIAITTYDLASDTLTPPTQMVIHTGVYPAMSTSWYSVVRSAQTASYGTSGASGLGNPVMLDGGVIAVYANGRLWLAFPPGPGVSSKLTCVDVGCDGFYGLLPAGRGVYLVGRETQTVVCHGMYRQLAAYLVTRVDILTIDRLCIGKAIRVPGLPLGTSSDGRHLYTASAWYLEDSTERERTVNIVEVGFRNATIEWALDIGDMDYRTYGDTLVLSEVRPGSGGGTGVGSTSANETIVLVVDLARRTLVWVYRLEGDQYLVYADADTALFQSSSLTEVVILDLRDRTSSAVHRATMGPLVYDVFRDGDKLHIIQGRTGVCTVRLL